MSYPTPSVVSKDVQLLQENSPQCQDIVTQEIPETEGSKAPLACYVQSLGNLVSSCENRKAVVPVHVAVTYPSSTPASSLQVQCQVKIQESGCRQRMVVPVRLYYNTGLPGHPSKTANTGSQQRTNSAGDEEGRNALNMGEIKTALSDGKLCNVRDIGVGQEKTRVNDLVSNPVTSHASVIRPPEKVYCLETEAEGNRTRDSCGQKPVTTAGLQGRKGKPAGSDGLMKWMWLRSLGVDVKQLEQGINSCPHEIPQGRLSIGAVYELSRLNIKWTTITRMLQAWMGPRFPAKCEYRKVQGVVRKIVKERLVLLKKPKTPKNLKALTDYLREEFTIPLHKERAVQIPCTSRKASDHKTRKDGQPDQQRFYTCQEKVAQLELALQNEVAKNKMLKESHQRERKNMKKQLKRRDQAIAKKNHLIRELSVQLRKTERAKTRACRLAQKRKKTQRKPRIQISVATQTR